MTAPVPSTKPYLLRALYDWCVDSGFTPHIVVAVDGKTRVPQAFVRDGQIVLNIAPYATHQLAIGNEEITCQARFSGVAHALYVPIANVAAIYARENGQGMAFEVGQEELTEMQAGQSEQDGAEIVDAAESSVQPDPDRPSSPPRSHLRIVK